MLSAAIQFAAWKGNQPHEQVTVGYRFGTQVRYMAESSRLFQCNRCGSRIPVLQSEGFGFFKVLLQCMFCPENVIPGIFIIFKEELL